MGRRVGLLAGLGVLGVAGAYQAWRFVDSTARPPMHAALVKIVAVNASSSATRPQAVKDGRCAPWFAGDSDSSESPWIEVDLGREYRVSKVQVFAGDWSSVDAWDRASRPREVEIGWSDGGTERWSMADERTVQTFTPDAARATSTIRLTLRSVHAGRARATAAISEILVFHDQLGPEMLATSAFASSEDPPDADGAYAPLQASDGVRDTMWCEGSPDSDGVGEWVEFELDGSVAVKGLRICSGMCANLRVHEKGSGPVRYTAMFSDGTSESFSVKDFPLPQVVRFRSPHTTRSVRLRIDEIRAGSEFDVACVSDVQFML